MTFQTEPRFEVCTLDGQIVAEAATPDAARYAVEVLLLHDREDGPLTITDAVAGPSATDPLAYLDGDRLCWQVTHGKGVFD